MVDRSIYFFRIVSSLSYIGSGFLLYIFTKRLMHFKRIALLSAFIYTLLPWSFEQSRITSLPNIALFIFLIFLNFFTFNKQVILKIISLVFLITVYFYLYPQVLNIVPVFKIQISQILHNFFSILSPEFFLFKNNLYWWGGVRDWGIINISLLPFMVIGILFLIERKKYQIIIWTLLIALCTALNSDFPETRVFYLSLPFISVTIATGIFKFIKKESLKIRIIFLILLAFYFYDLAQYFHYYLIHYPQQISGNISEIHEAF